MRNNVNINVYIAVKHIAMLNCLLILLRSVPELRTQSWRIGSVLGKTHFEFT